MAQQPPDQNYYRNAYPHAPPTNAHHQHHQLQYPPHQFRHPFNLFFDEHTGVINYNHIRPYIQNQHPDDSMVMKRPRRTRTVFKTSQIDKLEAYYLENRYLSSARLAELSAELSLGTAQVKIWFKNRRRREKIQSDQQKDPRFTYDDALQSPRSRKKDSYETDGGASLAHGLSETPATPMASPTHITSNYDSFCDGQSINAYYATYKSSNPHSIHHPPHHYPEPTSKIAASVAPTYFGSTGSQSQNRHQQQQHQQLHQNHQQVSQYQHYDYIKCSMAKQEQIMNYNNSYNMIMPNRQTKAMTAVESGTSNTKMDTTYHHSSAPNSQAYEPLTPSTDESPPQSGASEDMDDDTKTLLVLSSSTGSGESDMGSVIGPEDYSVFQKFKPTNSSDSNNYQCSMDTIMQAYNSHRNSSGNMPFAYCFN